MIGVAPTTEDGILMRVPTSTSLLRAIVCGVLFSSLLLMTPALPGHATRASKQQLLKRRADLLAKRHQVQLKLHQKKLEVQQTRNKLSNVEHVVRVEKTQLEIATAHLRFAREELKRANVELAASRVVFAQTQATVGQRLVAAYERGNQGYLDFLLSAADFSDLLERVQMAKYLRAQDQASLATLQQRRDDVTRYQSSVLRKTRQVALWQQQVTALHVQAVLRQEQTNKRLQQVKDECYDFETELVTLERDSAEVTAEVQRWQNSAQGRKVYLTHFVGGLGGMLPVHGRISSPFGWRVHPITHVRKLHTGVDLAAPIGTPIVAAGGGQVIWAGRKGGYGNAVMIDHGHGRTTLYGHMSSFCVRVGQVVAKGQLIGKVGSTGFSTGPHCHFEVRINGIPVNPLSLSSGV